jgi:hypothetical protein
VELGLFYLEQGRLDDADRFFQGLVRSQSVAPYRYLGNLGHATVLGLQDHAAESEELFFKLLLVPGTGGVRPEAARLLRQNPRLHQWVAKALDYDHANQTREHPFPRQLEPLRHPAGVVPKKT